MTPAGKAGSNQLGHNLPTPVKQLEVLWRGVGKDGGGVLVGDGVVGMGEVGLGWGGVGKGGRMCGLTWVGMWKGW